MSMHIEGPWLSTTRTKKRAERTTKTERDELERQWHERNSRLKQIGLKKESFEQFLEWVYGRGKKMDKDRSFEKQSSTNTAKECVEEYKTKNSDKDVIKTTREGYKDKSTSHGKLWVTGPCTTKQTPAYTGTKIIGIGTMHKSNAVPIFSDEEAKDISRMRR